MARTLVFDILSPGRNSINFEVIERRIRKFKEVENISIAKMNRQFRVTYRSDLDLTPSITNALLKIGYTISIQ